MNLTYAVVGTGGIGGYYGGCLAKAGHPVHFLLHSDYEYVLQNGLKIDSVRGDFHLKTVSAYKDSHDMPKCDVVLVCMKTTNNAMLKDILPPILHENSVVVLVQNGLNIEYELSQALPDTTIAGATAFICTTKVGPGHIHHAEYGALTIAPYCGDSGKVLKQVVEDFISAGVSVTYADDLNSVRWKKLVWNIPYNGLTVILNAATNELTFNPSTRKLVIDIMNEVVTAGRVCGASPKRGNGAAVGDCNDRENDAIFTKYETGLRCPSAYGDSHHVFQPDTSCPGSRIRNEKDRSH